MKKNSYHNSWRHQTGPLCCKIISETIRSGILPLNHLQQPFGHAFYQLLGEMYLDQSESVGLLFYHAKQNVSVLGVRTVTICVIHLNTFGYQKKKNRLSIGLQSLNEQRPSLVSLAVCFCFYSETEITTYVI